MIEALRFALLGLLAAATPEPTACRLEAMTTEPAVPGELDRFASRAGAFTLEHANPERRPAPDFFTDPIELLHADGSRCTLDAGNYALPIWKSADETTLVVLSYSGSSVWLDFVDVATCAVREELDVSGPTTTVDGDLIRFLGSCEHRDADHATCRPASIWKLDAACHPVRQKEASAELTRERFGVAFDVPSELEHPSTPEARVLGPARW